MINGGCQSDQKREFLGLEMIKKNVGELFSTSLNVPAPGSYLRRNTGAALWRLADRRVRILNPVFDAGSFVHLYVGDGENALAIGA